LKYKKYELKSLGDFEADKFKKSERPFQFTKGSLDKNMKLELDSMLIGSNRYAFLVIRNDSILYEFYNQNITDSSLLPSFSVAKSFVSTMVEMALEEGKIKSLSEPITNYIPELKERDGRFEKITIQHVLDMRSGVKSSENYYNPFSDVLRLGFGKNIIKKTLKLDIESEPNLNFDYKSVNTQLLGIIVERATKRKLQDYFYEKIYTPLEMQYDGTWMVDDKKHREVRAFCCLNMAALDYAKFGKLFLDKGVFNGKRLIKSSWVEKISNLDTLAAYQGYKNQWWAGTRWRSFSDSSRMNLFVEKFKDKILISNKFGGSDGQPRWMIQYMDGNYYARGLLNQYIYVIPEKNTILVHFGNSQNPNNPLKKGFELKVEEWFK